MKKTLILGGLLALFSASGLMAGNLTACTSCHGKTFEKPALGKSKIVKDMSKEEIAKALQGYKDGTYGGPMKGIMVNQVKNIKNPMMAADMVKGISDGESKESIEKKHCISKLKKIEDCVLESKDAESMQNCRQNLVNFAEMVKDKHLLK